MSSSTRIHPLPVGGDGGVRLLPARHALSRHRRARPRRTAGRSKAFRDEVSRLAAADPRPARIVIAAELTTDVDTTAAGALVSG
ncbi:hypothetical protein QF032_004176 [Streptomyces achromogenes]|uniref:hypothetical protein n=1 Tax=Streptomyces achromogenes TaxID=67255 RepID=UPI00278A1CBF|nr:hypothetical protein [Streptomyces achromogenes]MDQ0832332.1 hypothetical protein [Streptomyces achromogenes]